MSKSRTSAKALAAPPCPTNASGALPVHLPFAGFDPDVLYTTKELSEATGQTVAFYERRRAYDLPPRSLKLGRSVKYLGADIIAFLKSGYQSQGGDHD